MLPRPAWAAYRKGPDKLFRSANWGPSTARIATGFIAYIVEWFVSLICGLTERFAIGRIGNIEKWIDGGGAGNHGCKNVE